MVNLKNMVILAGVGLAGLYLGFKSGIINPETLSFKLFEAKKKKAQKETGERALDEAKEPPMTLTAKGFTDTSPNPVKQFWSKAHEILAQNLDKEQSVFKFVKATEEEATLKTELSPQRAIAEKVPERTEESYAVEDKISEKRKRILAQTRQRDAQFESLPLTLTA